MIYTHESLKTYLRARFSEDLARNPRVSLRGFAHKIGIAPSMLSEVFNSKKNVSREMALRIGDSLKLSLREAEYLCLLADFDSAKTDVARQKVAVRMQRLNPRRTIRDLSVEAFTVISEWYHFAILEMLNLPGFEFDSRRVGRQLGISGVEAQQALERLERLGLVVRDAKGKPSKTESFTQVASDSKSEALRKFHTTMLTKAAQALEQQGPKERFVGSETFVFDEARLPQATEIFEECFQKAIELSSQCARPQHVFHLGIQFFALNKGDRK